MGHTHTFAWPRQTATFWPVHFARRGNFAIEKNAETGAKRCGSRLKGQEGPQPRVQVIELTPSPKAIGTLFGMHHVNVDRLRSSYNTPEEGMCGGSEGTTRGAYRAKPSRRVWIKALEDKIIRAALAARYSPRYGTRTLEDSFTGSGRGEAGMPRPAPRDNPKDSELGRGLGPTVIFDRVGKSSCGRMWQLLPAEPTQPLDVGAFSGETRALHTAR